MDRPGNSAIRWSPNAARDSFLHINLQDRVLQIYEPTGRAQRGQFDYRKLAKHDDLPPLTCHDWSPSHPGLVAVGTPTGVANLLRVDDGSNAYVELGLQLGRTCHAVAFNTTGKLAVALERVRSDNSMYVWDVSRLSTLDPSRAGFPPNADHAWDPTDRLEPGVSVATVKFFEDNPSVLIAGIKGHGLRMHDLREQGHGVVMHFATKFCNNLAIDYADQNYFATSGLHQPGIVVWDRRAVRRQDASLAYVDAVDRDGIPWGAALRLDRAVQMEADPALVNDRDPAVRSIRFCRDHPGMLGVLSRAGQLRILSTKHEYVHKEDYVKGSPELLEIRRSYEMDPLYAQPGHKNDKIVSFDWITLRSPVLQPRLLALRASGAIDVLEKPSFTAEYPFKLIPWQGPYRGLEGEPGSLPPYFVGVETNSSLEGSSYRLPIELEPSQAHSLLRPLFTERALSNIPLFGPDRPDISAIVERVAATNSPVEESAVEESVEGEHDLPAPFLQASSIAEKLSALKLASQKTPADRSMGRGAKGLASAPTGSLPSSQLQRHELLLGDIRAMCRLSPKVETVVDGTMLLRAQEGYLFNAEKNQKILADDSWLQDAWAWVAGAEEAVLDGGMMSHPLDLSYLGVYTIWTNTLGRKPRSRLSDGAAAPDRLGWERCLNAINKKLGIPKFDGAETKVPHHREMCLEMCNWGRAFGLELESGGSVSGLQQDSSWHTMAAAQALFRGETKGAIQILKKASTELPELLFVSLALQLIGQGNDNATKGALDFDERVASKTDPYLRAISSIIATGDWTKIANQRSLPLRDRVFVAVRYFSDDELTAWLEREVTAAVQTGDIEGIVLTGITDPLAELLANYVEKFNDYQTATLLLSICAPRFLDDIRAVSLRFAYRGYLQRHRAFFLRSKYEVESTKRSKHQGRPTIRPPGRQFTLRCVYCDTETSVNSFNGPGRSTGADGAPTPSLPNFMRIPERTRSAVGRGGDGGETRSQGNPFTDKMAAAGVSCPNCKRHLPRCVVCLEVVGMPRSDRPELGAPRAVAGDPDARLAGKFPTFCTECKHVLHLDHARQWFARHRECPVPECRCKCNFRPNPELNYR